jgi:hypothetical protein
MAGKDVLKIKESEKTGNNMKYKKPEIVSIGRAGILIERPYKPFSSVVDNAPLDNSAPGPAYELDG